MKKITCKAIKTDGVKTRAKASIEWYDDGKPQYYCRGYLDVSTEEPLRTCKKCAYFVGGIQIEIDFKKFKQKEN